MSKKNIFFLITLLILITYALFKFKIFKKEEGFKIENIQKIDKIFISDMYGNNVTLKKKEGLWTVNNLKVREDAIKTLFSTIQKIEIKYPVSEKALPSIIREMSGKAVKFEFYNKNKNIKTFYVGGPALDYLGTYMKNEKSNKIYVTHIPDFNGYLTPRFNISLNQVHINEWRSKRLIDIDTINFKFNLERANKFKIEVFNNDYTTEYQIFGKDENNKFKVIFKESINDTLTFKYNKVKNIIELINNIEVESFETDHYDIEFMQKLNSQNPDIQIQYTTYNISASDLASISNKNLTLKLYKRHITNNQNEKILDQERMFGTVSIYISGAYDNTILYNDNPVSSDLFIIQNYTLNKIYKQFEIINLN